MIFHCRDVSRALQSSGCFCIWQIAAQEDNLLVTTGNVGLVLPSILTLVSVFSRRFQFGETFPKPSCSKLFSINTDKYAVFQVSRSFEPPTTPSFNLPRAVCRWASLRQSFSHQTADSSLQLCHWSSTQQSKQGNISSSVSIKNYPHYFFIRCASASLLFLLTLDSDMQRRIPEGWINELLFCSHLLSRYAMAQQS